MTTKTFILIGAGGHARVVQDIAGLQGYTVTGYADPVEATDIDVTRIPEESITHALKNSEFFISMGGQTRKSLARRLELYTQYADISSSPILIHPSAQISKSAEIGAGTMIGAGAVVQPNAYIGACSIINTGAIVEHDCIVGRGVHIAPGAVVLGNVRIGEASMIGAGAVLLPGARVMNGGMVKALERQK